jgi:hypothetical protein
MRPQPYSALIRGARRAALVATLMSCLVVACNLFIDADSLVGSGEGGVIPGQDGDLPDGTTIEGSVDGPLADGPIIDGGFEGAPGRPPPDGAVPQCVPPPPGDAEALAVTWAGLLTPPPCPAGYGATPAATAYADFNAPKAICDAGSCACPAVTGAATCSEVLDYYNDNACMQANGTVGDPLPTGICTRVAAGNIPFAKNRGTVNATGASCPAPTGTPQTTKPPGLFGTVVEACRPSTAGSAACADAGLVAMPPVAKEAFACYSTTGVCAPKYSLSFTFSSTQDTNDTRTCSCSCTKNVNAKGCEIGGTADFFAGNMCQLPAASTGNGQVCRPLVAYGASVTLTAPPTPAANSVSCAVATTSAGSVTPKPGTVKYCCMSRCDSCTVNAGVAPGPCASQSAACNANIECSAYRTCVDQQCAGVDCVACQTTFLDGGLPNPQYEAFKTCRTTNCASVCP